MSDTVLDLFLWDDSNHAPIYWLCGRYLGAEDNINQIIHALATCKDLLIEPFTIRTYCIDWECLPEDEKVNSAIADFFWAVDDITPDQMDLIIRAIENEDLWFEFHEKYCKK